MPGDQIANTLVRQNGRRRTIRDNRTAIESQKTRNIAFNHIHNVRHEADRNTKLEHRSHRSIH